MFNRMNNVKNKYGNMFEFTLQNYKHLEWTFINGITALHHFYSTFKQISSFTVNYVDHMRQESFEF